MRGVSDGKSYTLAPSIHGQVIAEFQLLLSQLVQQRFSDPGYTFKLRYQADSLLAKYCDADPTGARVRRAAAIDKWRSMELRNARTNVRLMFGDEALFLSRKGAISSDAILRVARTSILKVLGDEPDLEVLYGTFTSGASTSTRRKPGGVAVKFKVGADVTAPCYLRFVKIYETCETWKQYRELAQTSLFNIVDGGVLFTVPKSADIDRCAVKEPDINMFCQKGIGAFIRERLRLVTKINLNDQSRNQRLARKGSIDGSLATLDLSSASDLISDGLVRSLLPAPWFDLLDDCRSRVVEVDGEKVEVNMFSSMGNAFTFELETLIFWALSNAVAYLTGSRGTISVYGDDIIVPSTIGGLLAKVLAYFGLKVNTRKSFWRGPFRESCGKHWYKGMDVTPFYVREPIRNTERLIHFLNRLRAWAVMPNFEDSCDDSFFAFWQRWKRKIPTALWGGQDPARIDALVTLHQPRKRLVRRKRLVICDALGAYLHWLRTADSREGPILEPIVTSRVSVDIEEFHLRRNVTLGNVNIPYFPSEWLGYGDLDAGLA